MKISENIRAKAFRCIKKQFFINISLLFCIGSLHASPKIDMRSSIVDAGTSIEGVNETVSASFSFKNSGNSALLVSKIIPACGCTKIISYDSLVLPGKSGKINAEMNLKDFPAGPVAKIITVISNAAKDSVLRLGVKATVRLSVEVSEPYISLNAGDSARKSFHIFSQKDDMDIVNVLFKRDADRKERDPNGWQADAPMNINYKWMSVDSVRNDGYKVYRLTLFLPHINGSMLGMFRIQTNHPKKPEIFMRGTLLK
jgi:hypothetical protein